MRVIGFQDVPYEMSFLSKRKGKVVRHRWARLPSKRFVDQAAGWIQGFEYTSGDTLLAPALELALADPRKQMTVIIISDGELYKERDEKLLALLEKLQKKRAKRSGRAVVATIKVGNNTSDVLKKIGIAGKGGAFAWKRPNGKAPKARDR